MMLRLQRYRINVVYKKGSSLLLADTLSRATLPTTNDSPETNFEVFRINLEPEHSSQTIPGLKTQTLQEIKDSTERDPVLTALKDVIIYGWPDSKTELSPNLSPYWSYRDELTVDDDVIFKGLQVLIPSSLQSVMLQRVHIAHLGAASNIRMCRDILFWPGMKAQIEDMSQACSKCAQYRPQNPKELMSSQPIPEYPWQFISQDLCSFESGNYLVTVDHYSDFIEVDELDNTLAATVVAKTEAHVARHGIPEVILTDNGPQFLSYVSRHLQHCPQTIHHVSVYKLLNCGHCAKH